MSSKERDFGLSRRVTLLRSSSAQNGNSRKSSTASAAACSNSASPSGRIAKVGIEMGLSRSQRKNFITPSVLDTAFAISRLS